MRIVAIEARWLHCPLAEADQHTSDFGRVRSFDATLVEVRTDDGLVGYGEAKAGVGSAAVCASLVTCINEELAPQIVGKDANQIIYLWEQMYNGARMLHALSHGRVMPILGRRGLTIAAMSGIDIALWDLLGKRLGCPIWQLLGGACRPSVPAYASGGWANREHIGEQLRGYVNKGFSAVKMRVGAMDGHIDTSIERVHAARQALGNGIKLMVDAHGTLSVAEAKRFCDGVKTCDLFWFEEPVAADNIEGMAEVRAYAQMPIAAGESAFTRFDFRDLIQRRAVDVLQPDPAICGGITECRRIAALAETYQLVFAPHLWGSAISFAAGLHLAIASPAAVTLEYPLGANPLLHELVEEKFTLLDGALPAPTRPGLGVTPRSEFVEAFTVTNPSQVCGG